jgi:hypothetical protein
VYDKTGTASERVAALGSLRRALAAYVYVCMYMCMRGTGARA